MNPPALGRYAILVVLSAAVLQGADEVPSWMREIVTAKTPVFDPKVPAVVLFQETRVAIEDNGKMVTTERRLLRILSQEGRQFANGSHLYTVGGGHVRDVRAWVLGPSGDAVPLVKDNYFDRVYDTTNAYDDVRTRGVDARSKVDPGSVFGYEIVSEENALFTQIEWPFQRCLYTLQLTSTPALECLPALVSRYGLKVPEGWRAESVVYNHAPIPPLVDGTAYTWEVRDLQFIEPEPASPHLSSLEPRLCISWYARSGAKSSALSFADWKDASVWLSGLTEAPAEPTDAIRLKTATLLANSRTDWDRIQVLTRYVQTLRYVSIQTGTSRGGGYKPRPAQQTFTREYGDCKDKVTLLRAMLKAAGFGSYLVAVNSLDRTYAHEDWPSPEQFNHAVIAIQVAPDINSEAIVQHPTLGRLLIFDPTNGITPAGDLPIGEQGGIGLIAAGNQGGIIRLPLTAPSFNAVRREIRAIIDETGTLKAVLRESTQGQAAVSARDALYRQQRPEYIKTIERSLARGATGSVASKVDPRDDFSEGRFLLSAEFSAAGYAQIRAGRLMIFKPTVALRSASLFLTESNRKLPIELAAASVEETVYIKLPPNFKLDEKPELEQLETPFGFYRLTCDLRGDELVLHRAWEIKPTVIPVTQYGAVREFYERILNAEQSVAVLVRQ